MEELLHVYQYESEWQKWRDGDLEFEAKVLYELMNSDGDPYNDLVNFYNNPNAQTYRAAMTYYYRKYQDYCEKYPITPEADMDYSERIKHIK